MKTQTFDELDAKMQRVAMLTSFSDVFEAVAGSLPVLDVTEEGQKADEAEAVKVLEFLAAECPRLFATAAEIATKRRYIHTRDVPDGGIHVFGPQYDADGDEEEEPN